MVFGTQQDKRLDFNGQLGCPFTFHSIFGILLFGKGEDAYVFNKE